jgi:hypothetical protein
MHYFILNIPTNGLIMWKIHVNLYEYITNQGEFLLKKLSLLFAMWLIFNLFASYVVIAEEQMILNRPLLHWEIPSHLVQVFVTETKHYLIQF